MPRHNEIADSLRELGRRASAYFGRRRGYALTAVLLALTALAVARVAIVLHFTAGDNRMYSESLVRFRYAEMIMEGQKVPAVDTPLQWPEGFPTATMVLPLPDNLVGYTYRAWVAVVGTVDHYQYLRWFMAVYAALYIPAVALLFWVMFRRWLPALAAAALYTPLLPTFLRAAGNYLREDFATPPLLAATAFAWLLLEDDAGPKRSRWFCVALAASIAWALSCWHMAQFYVNVLLGVAFVAALAGRRGGYGLVGLGFAAGTVAAGALNLPLFSKGVLWSPTTAAAAALAVWGFWPGQRSGKRRRLMLLVGAGVVTVAATLLAGGGAYGHAYTLIASKIRFLGIHPADPTRLPPEARIFWMGPYDTTSAHRAVLEYGLLLVIAPAVFVWGLLSKGDDGRRRLSLVPAALTAVTGVLYLLLVRLTIFFAPWAVAISALPFAARTRPWARTAWTILLAGVLGTQVWWVFNYTHPTPVRRVVDALPQTREPLWDYGTLDNDVFWWLRDRTPAASPVLAQFGVSASVLYWGHRPVVLHPMFEVAEIRPKILEVSAAYAGPEEDLYNLCRKWGVNYVLFNAPVWLVFEPPGDRYFACAPEPPADAVGNLMQFSPEKLNRFRLVHETYSFRIFSVGGPYDGYRARRYHPYFDKNVFPALPSADEYYDVADGIRRAGEHYLRGSAYKRAGGYSRAAAEYGAALNLHADYEDANLMLGYCLTQLGRTREAGPHFRRAVVIEPDDPLAHTYMGSYYLATGNFLAARAEYETAYRLAPDDAGNLERLRLMGAK